MDIKQYDVQFNNAVKKLASSEKVTKEVLLDVSRTVLQAVQLTEDSGYLNRLVSVLTPVNRKVCIAYFRAFSGFIFSDDVGMFTKKDKKNYEAKKQIAVEFLADPHNNIWTWAERNIEIEEKKFEIETVGLTFKNLQKKAEKNGFTQADMLKQIFANGVELDTILQVMGDLYNVEVKNNAEQA